MHSSIAVWMKFEYVSASKKFQQMLTFDSSCVPFVFCEKTLQISLELKSERAGNKSTLSVSPQISLWLWDPSPRRWGRPRCHRMEGGREAVRVGGCLGNISRLPIHCVTRCQTVWALLRICARHADFSKSDSTAHACKHETEISQLLTQCS